MTSIKKWLSSWIPKLTEKDGLVSFPADRETLDGFHDLIIHHTGINIKLNPPTEFMPNMAVESGYMIPGNLLDIKNISTWLDKEESTIGRAFKSLKTDILKGWVDTSTGKVGGDYSKIEIEMFMAKYISDFLDGKFLKKHNVSMAEALAGVITHELGHCFTGFLYITRNTIDPLMITHAVNLIDKGRVYGKERAVIVRETLSTLECGTVFKDTDLDKMDKDALLVFFDRAVNTRDTRRTLSLGTSDRASEIYADLYAVRFGVPKAMVAALSSLESASVFPAFLITAMIGCAVLAGMASPALVSVFMMNPILMILINLSRALVPGDVYDSPYRRVKTLLRDHIIRLNNDTTLDKRAKVQMLKEGKEMEKIIDEMKSSMEGTFVQRFIGWMYSGSDFKAQEFENYTDELLGHTLSLYKDEFKD